MISSNHSADILMIGYGNTLRKDDGVGRYIVENFPPQSGLNILSVHQLTPELADDLAKSKQVIFVDVTHTQDKTIQVQSLTPTNPHSTIEHSISPQSLLAITQTLYDHVPGAWWVLIPGEDFNYGETFSDKTQACIPNAIQILEKLIQTLQKSGS